MQFELSHDEIKEAFKSVIESKGINMDGFTFQIKTSRKGDKHSRAIISTVDKAVAHPEVKEEPTNVVSLPTGESEVIEVEETADTSPFKRLFA